MPFDPVRRDVISPATLEQATEIRRNRDNGCTDYLKRAGKDRGSSVERPLGEIAELEVVDWLKERKVEVEFHPYLAGPAAVNALHEIVCGGNISVDVKASWRTDFLRASSHWELEVTPKPHKKLDLSKEFYYVFCYVSGPPYRTMIVGAMRAQDFHDPNKPPPWFKAGEMKNGRKVESDHWSLQLSDPRLIRPVDFATFAGPVTGAPFTALLDGGKWYVLNMLDRPRINMLGPGMVVRGFRTEEETREWIKNYEPTPIS